MLSIFKCKSKTMAKVLGAIMMIVSGFATLICVYLYWNSTAHLPYHPIDEESNQIGASKMSLVDTGMLLPIIVALFFLIAGMVIFYSHNEPETK